jgi:hypothetical protein
VLPSRIVYGAPGKAADAAQAYLVYIQYNAENFQIKKKRESNPNKTTGMHKIEIKCNCKPNYEQYLPVPYNINIRIGASAASSCGSGSNKMMFSPATDSYSSSSGSGSGSETLC